MRLLKYLLMMRLLNFLLRKNPPPLPVNDFDAWYMQYRNEMARAYGVNYAISIASLSFPELHRKYFDRGLSPTQALVEYGKYRQRRNEMHRQAFNYFSEELSE